MNVVCHLEISKLALSETLSKKLGKSNVFDKSIRMLHALSRDPRICMQSNHAKMYDKFPLGHVQWRICDPGCPGCSPGPRAKFPWKAAKKTKEMLDVKLSCNML